MDPDVPFLVVLVRIVFHVRMTVEKIFFANGQPRVIPPPFGILLEVVAETGNVLFQFLQGHDIKDVANAFQHIVVSPVLNCAPRQGDVLGDLSQALGKKIELRFVNVHGDHMCLCKYTVFRQVSFFGRGRNARVAELNPFFYFCI